MDNKCKDDHNTEAEPLLNLYDIHHASSSSSYDQQQTPSPPEYRVDMTAIDNTTNGVHHLTPPAAVFAPVHQCKYFSIPQFLDFLTTCTFSLLRCHDKKKSISAQSSPIPLLQHIGACQQHCPCKQWHSSGVLTFKGPWEMINERFGMRGVLGLIILFPIGMVLIMSFFFKVLLHF